jgi:formylmethanofuran dehydrogenase subunit E
MTDDLAERVAELEADVERLTETVEAQETVIDFLAGDANIGPVTANCPECGEGVLQKRSGLSWSKLQCTECATEWTL